MKLSNDVKSNWKVENIAPFNEMIISWNGQRPIEGKIDIFVRLYINSWSERFHYASWGKGIQTSFKHQIGPIKVYQDTVEVIGGKATGFEIEVTSPIRVHVYTNGAEATVINKIESVVKLPIPKISQWALQHPRNKDLCSPTSTTAVTQLLSKKDVNPVLFADAVKDQGFDIFGNWVLNVAEASHYLGSDWDAWVDRLSGFSDIYERLKSGYPVIVSVKGPLPGSALPYANGHLMVVVGYDPGSKQVHCMDPAFKTDDETFVSYKLDDFTDSWKKRGNVAYLFEKRKTVS